jgi:hypothetical protein
VAAFGSVTTAEVAAICDLPWSRAAHALWSLALELRVRAERVGAGPGVLWHAAT